MMSRLKVLIMLSLVSLCAPAFGAISARPGTLNYIEGSAYLQGKPIAESAVGSTDLTTGQVLSTGKGKAEILLTPGVYMRLDDNSSVKMISSDLTFTQLGLEDGRAMVEVDEIHPQNNLQIVEGGVPTQLLKTGLYEFNANDDTAEVFNGKAAVSKGDNKWVVIKSHHELALNNPGSQKPQSFNVRAAQDDLYQWSSLRSEYLSESNEQLSAEYGPYGFAPGWYWDPFYLDYTFMGPYPFYSPFGWGFYPFGYGYFGGFHPRPGYHGHGFAEGGFHDGGFHGGSFHGGGFHGGGGGHR
jgi:uncharacterized membrane protein YgcG